MVGSTPTRDARSSRLASKPYDRPSSASSSAANTPNKVSDVVLLRVSFPPLIRDLFKSHSRQMQGAYFAHWLESYTRHFKLEITDSRQLWQNWIMEEKMEKG